MLTIAVICFLIASVSIIATTSYEKKQSVMREEAEKLKLADTYTATSRPRRYANAINIEREGECFRFAVSEDRKTAYLRNGPKNPSVAVPVSSIIGCDIVRDPVRVGTLGRTILGGVIAGGWGAVAAGNTGKQYRNTVRLIVFLKDPARPRFEYLLLDGHVPYPNFQYEDMMKFAEDVRATVKAIKAPPATDFT